MKLINVEMKIRIVDIEDKILPGSLEFYNMVGDVWGGKLRPVQFIALVHDLLKS
jgi:hypothetical protein